MCSRSWSAYLMRQSVNATRVRVGVRGELTFVQGHRPYICYSVNTHTDRVLCASIAGHIIYIEILAKHERGFPCLLRDLLFGTSKLLTLAFYTCPFHVPFHTPLNITSGPSTLFTVPTGSVLHRLIVAVQAPGESYLKGWNCPSPTAKDLRSRPHKRLNATSSPGSSGRTVRQRSTRISGVIEDA